MFRRSPKTAIATMVNSIAGQPRHVACGDGITVLSPHLVGDRLYSLEGYVERFPNLHSMVLYEGGFEAWMLCDPRPRRNRDAVLSVLTAGLWRSRDCTQTACVVLSRCGIAVPRRVTTPKQLAKWLRNNTSGEWHDLKAPSGKAPNHPATQDAPADHGGAPA